MRYVPTRPSLWENPLTPSGDSALANPLSLHSLLHARSRRRMRRRDGLRRTISGAVEHNNPNFLLLKRPQPARRAVLALGARLGASSTVVRGRESRMRQPEDCRQSRVSESSWSSWGGLCPPPVKLTGGGRHLQLPRRRPRAPCLCVTREQCVRGKLQAIACPRSTHALLAGPTLPTL